MQENDKGLLAKVSSYFFSKDTESETSSKGKMENLE